MRRVTAFIFAALLLSACGVLSEAAPDRERNAPEVFDFVMVPGAGPGPRGAEIASSLTGSVAHPGSAVHLASVDTPFGRTHFASWTEGAGDGVQLFRCFGYENPSGGGASCTSGPEEPDLLDVGGESDGWSQLTLRPPLEAARILFTVEDGTAYRIFPVNGVGYVQWRSARGGPVDLVIYDADEVEIAREEFEGRFTG